MLGWSYNHNKLPKTHRSTNTQKKKNPTRGQHGILDLDTTTRLPNKSLTTRSYRTLLLNIRDYFAPFLTATSEEPIPKASTFHSVDTPSLPTPSIATTSNSVYASVAAESRIVILTAETIRHLAPYPCYNEPRNQGTNQPTSIFAYSGREDIHHLTTLPSSTNLVAFLVLFKI